MYGVRNLPTLPHKQQNHTQTFPQISMPLIVGYASTSMSQLPPGRLQRMGYENKNWFPPAHFHTLSGLTRLPSPLPPTTPPSPQGVLFWSQNPLCQHKSSFAFSCSTRHVTLENLQGIFHLASTSRGHHDPELPSFWGQPTSTCQSQPWQGVSAAWGELTKCGAGSSAACQQTVALVFHCCPFTRFGQLCPVPRTKSTN